ncbi:MAG: rRNA maturation RNase YbeY [Candidatus Moranbacteria bacterium CG_4_10_14_3_um_filter_44_15]|nr:MAG: rRNA maturation RNase YbeY [Candidatus Moranbacteria bacterium CG06_land_8_20_14_3_00_43_56]PIV83911.1 MAG: rRNA maturation RNase YbeY [Candidatus Moranbacteria bacterium CG17_big_fil_post_rev_8_21_14_2_50_44_12]PIW92930.1 MAG: rRNA maturation RNase YbeY [Candidatus Moranbacteria bacterium CG_4_8_14_3_um_filter_43_15]PIX90912.1 MAG: rRNA maturation RNase YbeY [Candidatus Moranbacteria bacterium CG_4_10_14_3_um_filter_44_15]PJA86464.1 MAG: rRNA maturation RNase YbeY [Candidatus Moranbact
MINVDIAKSSAGRKISQSFIRKVAKKTLFLSGKKINQLSLSIVLVGEKKIRALNRIYRKKNKPTDILSFNYSSGYNKKGVEGELFLCPEVIKKSAKEKNVSFQKELAFVLSHGVLHLLGMKHGRRTYEIQDEILNFKF